MTQKDDSGCMTVGDLSCLCFSTRSRFSTMNKYYFFKEKKIYKMFIWKLATNKKNVNIYLKDWKENTLKILFASFWVECYLIL